MHENSMKMTMLLTMCVAPTCLDSQNNRICDNQDHHEVLHLWI